MKKLFSLLSAGTIAFLASGCGQAPDPIPDPAELELALATVEAHEDGDAARLQAKVAAADRISSTVLRVAPERISPNVAAALLR